MSKFVNAVVLGMVSFILILAVFWYVVEIRQESQVSITDVGVGWGEANTRTTELRILLSVHNPHKSPVVLEEITFEVIVNGNQLREGTTNESLKIEPESDGKKEFRTTVPSRFVVDWIDSHLENGEKTRMQVRGEATFAISTLRSVASFDWESSWEGLYVRGVAEALHNCPSQASGSEPPPPCIASTAAEWDTSGTQSVLQTSFQMRNPNGNALKVRSWTVDLRWHNVTVATGAAPEALDLSAQGEGEIAVEVFFDRLQMPIWWPGHVEACEKSVSSVLIKFVVEEQRPDEQGSPVTHATSFEWIFAAPQFDTRFVCEPS